MFYRLLVRPTMPTLIAGLFAILAVTCPSSAQEHRAFVWNDQATGTGFPNGLYQFNSAGGLNSIANLTTGRYQVVLPGLGLLGGTAQVTAYGGNHYCKTLNWNASGTAMDVFVNCFGPSGQPVNGNFTLLFYATSGSSTTDGAYLWADTPTTPAAYIPNSIYQWNSRGPANTVAHPGPGSYRATLPRLVKGGGTALVTAYGSGSERCKVANWYATSPGIDVNVLCFNSDGTPVDTRFTLSFMTDLIAGGGRPYLGAFAWADMPYTASYTPSLSYQINQSTTGLTSSPITINRRGAGDYSARVPSQPPYNKTAAFVTGYGSGSDYCNIGNWTGSPVETNINIRCYNRTGAPVDAYFALQYLTDRISNTPGVVYFTCTTDQQVGQDAHTCKCKDAEDCYNLGEANECKAGSYKVNGTGTGGTCTYKN